ncbi:hypothetical protein N7519_003005 [Penicillium mononematosum]|uniref:uncharacterized protein n=1 Tax=Penicillium mononematosum TaxID=268346 RepID=UPI002547F3EC|nr:uncharacterized protein N7519_003005 [Penicillium mononematosum]KAJ6188097.1 hypothetical protein N7519_003005 [Penicillium mononematosum]
MGPFPHCVRVLDCENVTACTNCHWNDEDVRCKYHANRQAGPSQHDIAPREILRDAAASLALAEKSFRENYEVSVHARHSREAVHAMNAAAVMSDTQRLADEYGISNEHAT